MATATAQFWGYLGEFGSPGSPGRVGPIFSQSCHSQKKGFAVLPPLSVDWNWIFTQLLGKPCRRFVDGVHPPEMFPHPLLVLSSPPFLLSGLLAAGDAQTWKTSRNLHPRHQGSAPPSTASFSQKLVRFEGTKMWILEFCEGIHTCGATSRFPVFKLLKTGGGGGF